MRRLHFVTHINASKEKVWNALWDDTNYRNWTRVFGAEGFYQADGWEEGSSILFLADSGDGVYSGMYSVIDKIIPNEHISFRHLGVFKDGKEQPMDAETQQWTGAMEIYSLKEHGKVTSLFVELDTTDDHYDSFEDSFPKGLDIVKEIAEKG